MPGPNSIDGLASNLNTTAIVDAIMKAEHRNVDLLTERKTEATNQLTTYNSISALVLALSTSVQTLLRPSSFDASSVSVSDDTILDATATGSVAAGTYTLSIDALAKNHQIASQGFNDPAGSSLGTGTIQISVGSGSAQTITIDSSNNTLTALKNAINATGIGVTASVINDGSASNPYRLLLTSNTAGAGNTIQITTNLTGGTAPDFSGSSFDTVETIGNPQGTSTVSLGAGASYTGNKNKTYTFTVAGTGTQTIGSGPITLNWSDGTDSGSIQVSAADTEVLLTGTGSDGLSLSFGAGTLAQGDQFQVQTFSPLLQAAGDARITLGSTSGGGSPVTVTSATNEVKDLIGGLTLSLKNVTTAPVTITAAPDKDAIKQNITGMLDKYNEVMRAIDKQFSYNPDTGEAGQLLGDQFLLNIQSGLRSQLTGTVSGLPKALNMLRSIGIKTADNGLMSLVDTSTLNEMIDSNLDGVRQLFVNSGVSSNSLMSFVGAGTGTVESSLGYDVDITQAATHMVLDGASITNPANQALTLTSSNNTLKLTIDGVASGDLVLSATQYTSGTALAKEIQDKVNADAAIGNRGVKVEWVDGGSVGHLKFTSGSYGSTAKVLVTTGGSTAANTLGLATGMTETNGKDVVGTINGESATGRGQVLTGDSGNANTDGLSILVRMTQSDVVAGVDGTMTFSRGFAARLQREVDAVSRSNDGSIARRTKGIQAEIDDISGQIADQEARLAVRREKLFERFQALEEALNRFQAQGQFLERQLTQIAANTNQITSG